MTAQKDAYVRKLRDRLDRWYAEIDKLAAKADQADAASKVEYHQQLAEIRAKLDDIGQKLAGPQPADEGAWENFKRGLENSWEILKTSLSGAKDGYQRGYRKGQDQSNKENQ
jgi:hypothetical protein